jgi:hypothetical protein
VRANVLLCLSRRARLTAAIGVKRCTDDEQGTGRGEGQGTSELSAHRRASS